MLDSSERPRQCGHHQRAANAPCMYFGSPRPPQPEIFRVEAPADIMPSEDVGVSAASALARAARAAAHVAEDVVYRQGCEDRWQAAVHYPHETSSRTCKTAQTRTDCSRWDGPVERHRFWPSGHLSRSVPDAGRTLICGVPADMHENTDSGSRCCAGRQRVLDPGTEVDHD